MMIMRTTNMRPESKYKYVKQPSTVAMLIKKGGIPARALAMVGTSSVKALMMREVPNCSSFIRGTDRILRDNCKRRLKTAPCERRASIVSDIIRQQSETAHKPKNPPTKSHLADVPREMVELMMAISPA